MPTLYEPKRKLSTRLLELLHSPHKLSARDASRRNAGSHSNAQECAKSGGNLIGYEITETSYYERGHE